jgi:hypothetical protein
MKFLRVGSEFHPAAGLLPGVGPGREKGMAGEIVL